MTSAEHLRRGILWLASYPKSGNTWLRLQLANYFNERDEPHHINWPGVTRGIASSRSLFDDNLGLDSTDLDDDESMELRPDAYRVFAEAQSLPVWLKVHDAQTRLDDGRLLFPAEVSACAVYIVRNPLDVAVSRAYHDGHEDMERAVAMLCNPAASTGGGPDLQLRQIMRGWSAHVASWVDQTEIPVLTIRYEDMLADTQGVLESVIRFARPDVTIEIDRIAAAVANTAFENLQAMEAEHGFHESRPRQKKFFRSGCAGDWRNHLTEEQVTRIVDCHGPTMARFGYLGARGEPIGDLLSAAQG